MIFPLRLHTKTLYAPLLFPHSCHMTQNLILLGYVAQTTSVRAQLIKILITQHF
jgi:hypothetical protein